jgi:hypothetical protein
VSSAIPAAQSLRRNPCGAISAAQSLRRNLCGASAAPLLYSPALLTGDVRRVLSVEAADQRLLNTQAKKKAGIASRENDFF